MLEQNFKIIQGGMGVGVSNWHLANTVARTGQLGVISGTGIATVLARRLQLGDEGGHMRRALAAFPWPDMAERVVHHYFVPGGVLDGKPLKLNPMPIARYGRVLDQLTVVAAFVEVYLAKEGHDGGIGMNLLEKVQTPTLSSLYGSMLAGVDFILMGAGIPRFIPGTLDALAAGARAELKLDIEEATPGEPVIMHFDPKEFAHGAAPVLQRPAFLGIISSATLALTLARKSNGKVDGFVVEGAIAGGHNAPPRGPLQLTARGEPIYGPRDEADLKKIKELGLPFYLAGGFGTPEQLNFALERGANGIQVGTAFAFCNESGIREDYKREVIAMAQAGNAQVFTDPRASPTGFPFKVLQIEGTLSEEPEYQARKRICDLGYLRKAYRKDDGTVGYRCPAEPVEDYVAKGGDIADTVGRKCLCNTLCSVVGLGQNTADGTPELPMLTAGDDVAQLARYVPVGRTSYSAGEVLAYLLGQPAPVRAEEAAAESATLQP